MKFFFLSEYKYVGVFGNTEFVIMNGFDSNLIKEGLVVSFFNVISAAPASLKSIALFGDERAVV